MNNHLGCDVTCAVLCCAVLCCAVQLVDLGCGYGGTAVYVAQQLKCKAVGVNISPFQVILVCSTAAPWPPLYRSLLLLLLLLSSNMLLVFPRMQLGNHAHHTGSQPSSRDTNRPFAWNYAVAF